MLTFCLTQNLTKFWGCETTRKYTANERKLLKACRRRFTQIQKYGKKTNICERVRYVTGCENDDLAITNPFFKRYENVKGRNEPKTLLPYQIEFLISKGYLPQNGMHLSHICGTKCITVTHIRVESIKINNERKKCHKKIQKKLGIGKKRKRGAHFLKVCNHTPSCFLIFGEI